MNELVTCPAGCDAALPPVEFSLCAPNWRKGEIIAMAFGRADTTAFTDYGAAGEWADRVSPSASDIGSIRILTVRANKPASNKTTLTLTGNRTVTTERNHTINITIDEVNDVNYDFARMTQCGIVQMRAWYISNGGADLYGGNSGILGTLFLEPIFDEGTGTILRFVGTFTWTRSQDPPRVTNPIAGFESASAS